MHWLKLWSFFQMHLAFVRIAANRMTGPSSAFTVCAAAGPKNSYHKLDSNWTFRSFHALATI
jgi:hypothetical protein